MINHSITPPAFLLSENEQSNLQTMQVDGGFLEVITMSGEQHVNRVISTDLRHYLNPAYLPGSQLKKEKENEYRSCFPLNIYRNGG